MSRTARFDLSQAYRLNVRAGVDSILDCLDLVEELLLFVERERRSPDVPRNVGEVAIDLKATPRRPGKRRSGEDEDRQRLRRCGWRIAFLSVLAKRTGLLRLVGRSITDVADRAFERVVVQPDEPIHSAFAADWAFTILRCEVFFVAHTFYDLRSYAAIGSSVCSDSESCRNPRTKSAALLAADEAVKTALASPLKTWSQFAT